MQSDTTHNHMFQEDVFKGRDSEYTENVRASLKNSIVERKDGYEKSEMERFEEEHSPKVTDFI